MSSFRGILRGQRFKGPQKPIPLKFKKLSFWTKPILECACLIYYKIECRLHSCLRKHFFHIFELIRTFLNITSQLKKMMYPHTGMSVNLFVYDL